MLSKLNNLDYFPARQWLALLDKDSLRADGWAGLISAIIVLPQAIAFAAIAGLPIEYGFYTAMVTPIVAALFGSSRHMISGPTTAISVMLFASISTSFEPGSPEYIQAAITLTLLAGLFQLGFGALRLGMLANFISPSVMIGFTAGAAILIVFSQLPNALGLESLNNIISMQPFVAMADTIHQINVYALVITLSSLLTAIIVSKFAPRWPNYLLALAVGTLLAELLAVDEKGVSFVVNAAAVIPPFAVPDFSLANIRDLAQGALTIALVALLEATAISRSLATKSDQDINVNQEFVGQGLSNIIGSFFSAYMGSGSFTRSALNYESGAKSPLAAIFASILLFFILLFFGNWIRYIPEPAIAGIILIVAYRLFELTHITEILRTSYTSSTSMIMTFFSTLIVGLEFGIYVGVLVSLFFYLHRSSTSNLAMIAPDPNADRRHFRNAMAFKLNECPQLGFARLDGQLYFGSMEDIRRQLRELEIHRPKQVHIVMLMKGVSDIDMHGAHLLNAEYMRRIARGGKLYITARQPQISKSLNKYGVIKAIKTANVFTSKGVAIETIVPQLDADICRQCKNRIFKECPSLPEVVN